MTIKGNDEERRLIDRIAVGDEHAFSVLFFNYLPVLQSFAIKFSKSEEAAEEIIQEAFLRIWLNRDKLPEVENIKAYLYKFVANESLSYLRKKLKEDKIIDQFRERQPRASNITTESIHLNEINRIVNIAIAQLPSQRRRIYQLSRQEGKTIPEIAEILAVSPNTVKNALVIALKSIRSHLDQHGIVFMLPIAGYFFKIN